MSINTDAVQRLYVAYFNRPADPTGLAYWEGQLGATPATQAQLASIASGFSGSAEYAALYAGQSNQQIVSSLYSNLFGRSAEQAGVVYWAGKLTDNSITFADLALQLTYSAQGTDAIAIANKLSASKTFTEALNTPAEMVGYSGMASAASARSWLATVTDSSATLASAVNCVDTAVTMATKTGTVSPSPVVPPVVTPPVTGVVGDLGPDGAFGPTGPVNVIIGTEANDNLAGTDGIDVIHAGLGNDTVWGNNGNDVLNGGSGADNLNGGSGDDVFLFVNRLETTGVDVGVQLVNFSGIDRITDFNGNSTFLGDRIQLGPVTGYFDQNFSYFGVSKGVVTQVTVQNNASSFDGLLASIESAAHGVASTNSLVQFYDVTITAGNGAYNGGAGDHVLVFNTGASQINALDTFIGIVGSVVPNDIIFT